MPDAHTDDGEYSVENGAVIGVGPEYAVVRIEKKAGECGGCRACSLKSLCGGDKDAGTIDLRAPLAGVDPRPRAGDAVRIRYRPANAAAAALAMFLPPLMGLLAGGLAGYRLADGGDALFLAGCAAGLAAGVGTSVLLSRLVPALRPVVRLLPATDEPAS